MSLGGNQRGGGKDLANHLMKEENERVTVHNVRGFVATDLHGAFQESYAISRATNCKQYLYSLSLNPPKGESVSVSEFEDAVARAEDRLKVTMKELRRDETDISQRADALHADQKDSFKARRTRSSESRPKRGQSRGGPSP